MADGAKSALARIDWQGQNKRLGLLLVNHDRESFFLYAEPIICMMGRPDEYLMVKQRDREPEKAIGYHGGAIWGDVDVVDSSMIISLHFGALWQDIVYKPDSCKLINVLGTQRYQISTGRLKSLVKEIKHSHAEQREFDRLTMEAECTPLQASFLK